MDKACTGQYKKTTYWWLKGKSWRAGERVKRVGELFVDMTQEEININDEADNTKNRSLLERQIEWDEKKISQSGQGYIYIDKREAKLKDKARTQEMINGEVSLINYRIKKTHKVSCFKDLNTIHRAEAILRCRTHDPSCGNAHWCSFPETSTMSPRLFYIRKSKQTTMGNTGRASRCNKVVNQEFHKISK